MDKGALNRVEHDLYAWKRQEEKCADLFSPQVLLEKSFLKGKLDFFGEVQDKYTKSASDEERIFLQILKGERKKLEAVIYPGLVGKISRSLELLFSRDKQKQAEQLQILRNEKTPEAQSLVKHEELKKNISNEKILLKTPEKDNKDKLPALKDGNIRREQIKELIPRNENPNGRGLKLK
jgi:hypothetical protein